MPWPWNKAETELDREIRHHLESLAEAYERDGMSREEAVRRARKDFGGIEQAKEECRDERRWNWLAQLAQDLRFGRRMMRKSPAVTLAAAISLALGIGATTSILSLADALLWRKMAVPSPERMLEVFWQVQKYPQDLVQSSSGSSFGEGAQRVSDFFSAQAFETMRDAARGKGRLAAYLGSGTASVSFRGVVSTAHVRSVSGEFFSTLGLQPSAGRLLRDSDDDPAAEPVIVITDGFRRDVLGGAPDIVDHAVRINNRVYTVAGVLPREFAGLSPGDQTQIYAPLRASPALLDRNSWYREQISNPRSWWMQMIARSEPGVSATELKSALDAAFASSWAAQPTSAEETPSIRLVDASRGLGAVRREFGDPLWVLMGMVGLVLVVVCANIANLLLARAVKRETEVALRVSLGGGRGRLVRQMLTESLLLAAVGGVMSIPVAAVVSRLMVGVLSSGTVGVKLSSELDARLFAGTAVLAVLTAVFFGLYPALRAVKVDPWPALKEGGAAGSGRRRWAAGKALVLAQMALGVLLVSSAFLYTSRLRELVQNDAGFERAHAVLFDVRPGEIGYEGEKLRRFYFDVEDRLSSLPGVEAAGMSRTRPMKGGGIYDRVALPGGGEGVQSALHRSTAAFLTAHGVPLVAGRSATRQEVEDRASVAVVSEALAEWLGLASPLGARLALYDGQEYEVIGVARQASYARVDRTDAPVLYLPFDYEARAATVVVRTSAAPASLLSSVREAMRGLDPNLPLMDVYTMEQQISRTLQRERLFAWLCGGFGALALVLCVVGLYGLMSHTTASRTPEIGIRKALGATPGDVTWTVLREALSLAGLGFALGAPLVLYGVRFAERQRMLPEGTTPYGTLAAAIGVLAVAALLAALAPAVRAAAVDPMDSLRG